MNKFVENFMDNIKTKSIGFYIGAAAWVMTLIGFIAYFGSPVETYAVGAVYAFAGAVVLFIVCSAFKETSVFAPIFLVVGNFLALWAIAAAPMTEDYFSTAFFSGFSIGGLFGLPAGILLPLLGIIFGGILAIVATFMPQNKEAKTTADAVSA